MYAFIRANCEISRWAIILSSPGDELLFLISNFKAIFSVSLDNKVDVSIGIIILSVQDGLLLDNPADVSNTSSRFFVHL